MKIVFVPLGLSLCLLLLRLHWMLFSGKYVPSRSIPVALITLAIFATRRPGFTRGCRYPNGVERGNHVVFCSTPRRFAAVPQCMQSQP